MNRKKCLTSESRIGELLPSVYMRLCQYLNVHSAWKQMVPYISTIQGDSERFSIDDIQQFELSSDPTKAILNAWSTDCVTLGRLVSVLESAQLQREAKLVNDNITSPVCNFTTTERVSVLEPQIKSKLHEIESDEFRYSFLACCTNNFDLRPLKQGGCYIGFGGSADVFRGIEPGTSREIAVKRLRANESGIWEQFKNELRVLSSLGNHMNLVTFLGLSQDGPSSCIVYEYMAGGSLLERLISVQPCKKSLTPLKRVTIARDISQAISYIHSRNLIHRDVKTANILLDHADCAKLGDYGITRYGPKDLCETSTQNVIGTKIYMPLEYIRDGELSFKTDSYSFGVVLLELLTGLPPYYCGRDERNIVSYIEQNYTVDNIFEVVDEKVAAVWDHSNVEAIFNLANKFLSNKNRRPLISDHLEDIESWLRLNI